MIWIGIVNLVKCNFNWNLENTDDYIFLLIKNGTGCISAIVCSGVSALMKKNCCKDKVGKIYLGVVKYISKFENLQNQNYSTV